MSRIAFLVLAAAIAALALPAESQAQPRRGNWEFRAEGPTSGAFRTNLAGDAQMEIQCNSSRQIELRFWWPRRRAWQYARPAAIRIDGGPAQVMEVDGGDAGFGFTILGDTPDITLSPRLFAAIKNGSALVLDGPAASRMSAQARTFSLEGSGPAIARVEQACGLAAQPAAPTSAPAPRPASSAVPPLVAQTRDASFRECREMGGRPSAGAGYILSSDLNRDGVPDYVIDENGLDCRNALSPNCGSLGCAAWAFISMPGGYRRVDLPYTNGTRIEQGTTLVLTLRDDGPVRFRWNGSRFVR